MQRTFVLCAVAVLVLTALTPAPATATSPPAYPLYFGAGNVPPGCTSNLNDNCYHMRNYINPITSAKIDVLIVPPVSPLPERDMRIMRQAIEMWDAGIHYLAAEKMGMKWLADGVVFNIAIDDDALTTDPLWDPEIVVIASNPVGGAGIGIMPVSYTFCKGENPFAGLDWDTIGGLAGFDNHHGRSGTYVDSCNGNATCFAINGAIDPEYNVINLFNLFDLVAHEVGHCLTIGHVGNGLDHTSTKVPCYDIMAYQDGCDWPNYPLRCVSTLDVEGFAIGISHLDIPGKPGQLRPNHATGNTFQAQHPDQHFYATSNGSPEKCIQPDVGPVAGPPVNFYPGGGGTSTSPSISVTEPTSGTQVSPGPLTVRGNVEYVTVQTDTDGDGVPDIDDDCPGTPQGTLVDATGCPQSPMPATDPKLKGSHFAYNTFTGTGASNIAALGVGTATGDSVPKYPAGSEVSIQSRTVTDSTTPARTINGAGGAMFIFDSEGNVARGPFAVTCTATDCRAAGNIPNPVPAPVPAGSTTLKLPEQPGRYYIAFRIDFGSGAAWITDTTINDPWGHKPIDVFAVPAAPGSSSPPAGFFDALVERVANLIGLGSDKTTTVQASPETLVRPGISTVANKEPTGLLRDVIGPMPQLPRLPVETPVLSAVPAPVVVAPSEVQSQLPNVQAQLGHAGGGLCGGLRLVAEDSASDSTANPGGAQEILCLGADVVANRFTFKVEVKDAAVRQFPGLVYYDFYFTPNFGLLDGSTQLVSVEFPASGGPSGFWDVGGNDPTGILFPMFLPDPTRDDIQVARVENTFTISFPMSYLGTAANGDQLVDVYVDTNDCGSGASCNLRHPDYAPDSKNGVYTFGQAAALAAVPGGPYSGSVNQAIAISGSATGGAGGATCTWTSTGATFGNANACSTTVTYASAGSKTLTLTVTDATGSASSHTTVTVSEGAGAERVEVTLAGKTASVPVTGSPGSATPWSTSVDLTGVTAGTYNLTARWVSSEGETLATHTVAGIQVTQATSNLPPVAIAVKDRTVRVGTAVTLGDLDSSDPDGDSLSYAWSCVSSVSEVPCPSATGASSSVVSFTAPSSATVLTWRMTVSDGRGGSAFDEVQVSVVDCTGEACSGVGVANVAPTVSLDPLADLEESEDGHVITVKGTVSDGNGATDIYGVKATLVFGSQSTPLTVGSLSSAGSGAKAFQFNVELPGDAELGTYRVQVVAKDFDAATGSDSEQFDLREAASLVFGFTEGKTFLDFGTGLAPGAIDVRSTNAYTVKAPESGDKVLEFRMADFTQVGGVATVPVFENAEIEVDWDGDGDWSNAETIAYTDGANQPLGTLPAGQTAHVRVVLSQLPSPLPDGVYTTTFSVTEA
jgi:hypothetical protein